jgi:hypothetical protein
MARIMGLKSQKDILHQGKLGEKVSDLKGPRQTKMGATVAGHPADVSAKEINRAFRSGQLSADEVEQSGFPCAVGTDDDHSPFFTCYRERDIAQHGNPTEILGEVFNPQFFHVPSSSVGL